MCLLIAKPGGVTIDPMELGELCEAATITHPDGFGMAFVGRKGSILVKRGMYKPDRQEQLIAKIGDAPAIIHWRFGTGGSKTVANCHPFVLPDKTVFAHNGVLPYETTETKSDTRLVAECSIDVNDLKQLVQEHISRSNKVAYLQPKAEAPVILGEEFGTWKNGLWYSNLSHDWNSFFNRGRGRGYSINRTTATAGTTTTAGCLDDHGLSMDFGESLDSRVAHLVRVYGLDAVLDAAYEADEEMYRLG